MTPKTNHQRKTHHHYNNNKCFTTLDNHGKVYMLKSISFEVKSLSLPTEKYVGTWDVS
jgi:hypothetical protein